MIHFAYNDFCHTRCFIHLKFYTYQRHSIAGNQKKLKGLGRKIFVFFILGGGEGVGVVGAGQMYLKAKSNFNFSLLQYLCRFWSFSLTVWFLLCYSVYVDVWSSSLTMWSTIGLWLYKECDSCPMYWRKIIFSHGISSSVDLIPCH